MKKPTSPIFPVKTYVSNFEREAGLTIRQTDFGELANAASNFLLTHGILWPKDTTRKRGDSSVGFSSQTVNCIGSSVPFLEIMRRLPGVKVALLLSKTHAAGVAFEPATERLAIHDANFNHANQSDIGRSFITQGKKLIEAWQMHPMSAGKFALFGFANGSEELVYCTDYRTRIEFPITPMSYLEHALVLGQNALTAGNGILAYFYANQHQRAAIVPYLAPIGARVVPAS